MKRADVVAEARTWLGLPWKHQGRSRNGVDCIGLLVMLARKFGVEHEDRTDYGREPTNHTLLNHLRKFSTLVRGAVRPGDIGLFRQSRYACHVGVFSEKDGILHVIHSTAASRRVIEEPFDGNNGNLNLIEVRAFPGLED